jgi:predicted TIM-barrel fold metal-dependent hydrolase
MTSFAFYDAHCHALTLAHPSFLSFTQTLRRRGFEEVYAQITSPNYLIAALFFKTGERVRNMLSVMEHDVGSIFELMEDDLAGEFAKASDPPPLLCEGELRLGRLRFDRLVLCPLIMDFQGAAAAPSEGTYYDRPTAKPVTTQIRDVLEGIHDYRNHRPNGFLEIRPFLGVDTRHYTIDELSVFLAAAFEGYEKGEGTARAAASRRAFEAMRDFEAMPAVPGRFAGVKVYPPLGFDPWPDEGPEREKLEMLWSFCESRDIPVITHCDDQGFRVVALEESWRFTSPARWEPVLRAHPDLRLDFAHFGVQYSRPIGRPPSTEWTDTIVELMVEYPKVYADISFDGSEAEYYRWLDSYIDRMSPGRAALLEDRIFFGSDFMVNLTKVRSYSDYYRLFDQAPLSDERKRRFGHDNPERFLFGVD